MDIPDRHSKGFFDQEKNVKQYIEASEGLDGRILIEILKKHLKPGSTVLELGIGAGKDLELLGKTFNATGSDNSHLFLDLSATKNPNADLLLLDARTLATDRKFDCIYSNKVLHHLTKADLKRSFKRQRELLNDSGILFHTFWHGNRENKYQDLRFIQYRIDELIELTKNDYDLIKIDFYQELLGDDSIYLILRKT